MHRDGYVLDNVGSNECTISSKWAKPYVDLDHRHKNGMHTCIQFREMNGGLFMPK